MKRKVCALMTTEDPCVLALPSSRCVCAHVCACLCLCVRACVHVPLWVSNRRLLSTQAFLRRVAFAAGNLEGGGNASHWDGEQTCLLCCKGWGILCLSQSTLLIPVGSGEGEEVTQTLMLTLLWMAQPPWPGTRESSAFCQKCAIN